MEEPNGRVYNRDILERLVRVEERFISLAEKIEDYIDCSRAETLAMKRDVKENTDFRNKVYWIVGIPTSVTGILITLLLTGVIG